MPYNHIQNLIRIWESEMTCPSFIAYQFNLQHEHTEAIEEYLYDGQRLNKPFSKHQFPEMQFDNTAQKQQNAIGLYNVLASI